MVCPCHRLRDCGWRQRGRRRLERGLEPRGGGIDVPSAGLHFGWSFAYLAYELIEDCRTLDQIVLAVDCRRAVELVLEAGVL